MVEPIGLREFLDAEGAEDWRLLCNGATAYFRTGTLADGARLAQAISEIAGIEGHPPAIDIRPDGVTVRLITLTDDYYGPSQADLEMARAVSAAAKALGFQADPSAVQDILVVPGAPNAAEIVPFWQAVLGYEPRPDSPEEDLVDPRGIGAPFWFEAMQEPRPDGGGAIHIAVWLPEEQAEQRVQAALAAGGRIVRDEFAPTWWTLADAAGNEADISTVAGRG